MSEAPKTIWLQRPNRDPENEWCGEVTWCEDKQNAGDTCYIKAGVKTTLIANEITQLRAENEKLKEELAEAKKDSERLEFLVENPEFSLDFIGKYHTDEKRFIRRSIDAAMKGK